MSGRAAARPAEEHLRKSFAEGKVLDLRTGQRNRDDLAAEASWPTGRQIRADIVMDLLRGDGQAGSVMSVAGARIVGTLDLQHARVNSSLILRDCYFDEPPDLSEARAVSVCLAGSRFPSLACYGLQVEGDMDLRRVNSGRIDLFGARLRIPASPRVRLARPSAGFHHRLLLGQPSAHGRFGSCHVPAAHLRIRHRYPSPQPGPPADLHHHRRGTVDRLGRHHSRMGAGHDGCRRHHQSANSQLIAGPGA